MDTSVLVLTAVLTLAGYALTCRIWPYGHCRRCHGSEKLRSPFGANHFRYCPRCNHTGLRLRTGRRLWSRWRDLRKDIYQ